MNGGCLIHGRTESKNIVKDYKFNTSTSFFKATKTSVVNVNNINRKCYHSKMEGETYNPNATTFLTALWNSVSNSTYMSSCR